MSYLNSKKGLARAFSIMVTIFAGTIAYLLTSGNHPVGPMILILPLSVVIGGLFGYGFGLFLYYINPSQIDDQGRTPFKPRRLAVVAGFLLLLLVLFLWSPVLPPVLCFMGTVSYIVFGTWTIFLKSRKHNNNSDAASSKLPQK